MWKSGLLDSADSINLAEALLNGQATFASLNKLRRTDFSALQLLPFDYNIYNSPEVESTVNALKNELRDACLLHYNMDLSAVQRYGGCGWIGEHRRTDQMPQVMYHILPDDLFLEIAAAMVDGVPNLLNAELQSEEVASLLATPNLPTVAKNPELFDKAILKEERNHLSMVFSSHLTAFTPNLGIIKLGILDKKHKKPRMYQHSSYISEDLTHPINKLVDCELSEPTLGYAHTRCVPVASSRTISRLYHQLLRRQRQWSSSASEPSP